MAGGCDDLRAVLHLDGADFLETLLREVTALSEQVHPTPLEVLKLKEVYLKNITQTQLKHFFEPDIKSALFDLTALVGSNRNVEVPSDCAAPRQSGCQCCPGHLSGT